MTVVVVGGRCAHARDARTALATAALRPICPFRAPGHLRMLRAVDEHRSHGFLDGGNVWVLIPLAGISIPIVAIVAESPLAWVVGAVILIAAVTAAVRHIVLLRHRLRLEELAAQERVSLAERDRFAAIDRLVEPELRLPVELHRQEEPPER